jgi:hypothetical protein
MKCTRPLSDIFGVANLSSAQRIVHEVAAHFLCRHRPSAHPRALRLHVLRTDTIATRPRFLTAVGHAIDGKSTGA